MTLLGLSYQTRGLEPRKRLRSLLAYSAVAWPVTAAAYAWCFHRVRGGGGILALLARAPARALDATFSFHLRSNLRYTVRGSVQLFFGGWPRADLASAAPLTIFLVCALAGTLLLLGVKLAKHRREIWNLLRAAGDEMRQLSPLARLCLLGILLNRATTGAAGRGRLALLTAAAALWNFTFLRPAIGYLGLQPGCSEGLQPFWPASDAEMWSSADVSSHAGAPLAASARRS